MFTNFALPEKARFIENIYVVLKKRMCWKNFNSSICNPARYRLNIAQTRFVGKMGKRPEAVYHIVMYAHTIIITPQPKLQLRIQTASSSISLITKYYHDFHLHVLLIK